MDLPDIRLEYSRMQLDESQADPDPIRQLRAWLDQAIAAGLREPNAMTVATCGADGVPSARVVLLRGLSEKGLTFYTSYEGRKAQELAANPRAALCFYWADLERQVRVEGTVERTSAEDSDAYFATRPRGSQLGAWASHQSQVLPDRRALERQLAEVEARFAGGAAVPRPPDWGGFCVHPLVVEFWQGRTSRLHDRLRYRRQADGWVIDRLSP